MYKWDEIYVLVNEEALSLQEKSYQYEINRNTDAQGRNHGNLLCQPQSHKEIQKEGLQTVIDDMRQGKPCASLGIRLHLECISGAGNEIEDKADDISHGIGHRRQDMVVLAQARHQILQGWHHRQIDDILQDGSNATHYPKTDNLAKFLTLGEVYLFIFLFDTHIVIYETNVSFYDRIDYP